MKFTKMHGCGNDYIYVDGAAENIPQDLKEELAIRLSDRHFGIGADGIIFINPSDIADFEMEMYNADGSRGRMCGNGIRCVAKFVYDKGLTDKTTINIESFGAIKIINVDVKEGKVTGARVDMGEPILDAGSIPVKASDPKGNVVRMGAHAGGEDYLITCVSMGNPHAVIFMNDSEKVSPAFAGLDMRSEDESTIKGASPDRIMAMTPALRDLDLEKIGPFMENNDIFPERTNTEYVVIKDRSNVEMRVWERGSGETFACGTGCCAVAVAGVLCGLTDREVNVRIRGGELNIIWDDKTNHVFMSGPAETVFEGEVDI